MKNVLILYNKSVDNKNLPWLLQKTSCARMAFAKLPLSLFFDLVDNIALPKSLTPVEPGVRKAANNEEG